MPTEGWNVPGNKRGPLAILHDVLVLADGGRRKTSIMRRANLSHGLVVKYLDFCVARGFVSRDEDGVYAVTAKGEALREAIAHVRDLLDEADAPPSLAPAAAETG